MKKFFIILTLALVTPALTIAAEQDAADKQFVVKSEKKSAFKGLLYSVWGKLRALNPTKAERRQRTVVTAGVRGAETTESLINPYWKDDKTNDKDYIKELDSYTSAQQLAEDGDLNGAVKALTSFLENHEDSDLKPNAQFALGISYGGLGQNQPSIKAFKAFVNDNPKHPLVSDAKQVIAELK